MPMPSPDSPDIIHLTRMRTQGQPYVCRCTPHHGRPSGVSCRLYNSGRWAFSRDACGAWMWTAGCVDRLGKVGRGRRGRIIGLRALGTGWLRRSAQRLNPLLAFHVKQARNLGKGTQAADELLPSTKDCTVHLLRVDDAISRLWTMGTMLQLTKVTDEVISTPTGHRAGPAK